MRRIATPVEEVARDESGWRANALGPRDVEPFTAYQVLILPLISDRVGDGAAGKVSIGERTHCREDVPDSRDAGRIARIGIVDRQAATGCVVAAAGDVDRQVRELQPLDVAEQIGTVIHPKWGGSGDENGSACQMRQGGEALPIRSEADAAVGEAGDGRRIERQGDRGAEAAVAVRDLHGQRVVAGVVVIDRGVDRVCVGRGLVGVTDFANDLAAGEDVAIGITRQVDVQKGITIDDVGAAGALEPVAAAAAEHDVAARERLRALREEVAFDRAVDGPREYRSVGRTEVQIDRDRARG